MNNSFNTLKLSRASSAAQSVGGTERRWLGRFGTAVWQTLEAVGRSRARRELLSLADRWQFAQPELAAQLRASCREPARP